MFQYSTLDNGIRVVTESVPSNVVAVGVWIEAGARDEHDLTSGSSHFVEHMLFKGTQRRDAHRIAREFDVLGGMANAFTGAENTCYHATVLADRLPEAVDLLGDMLLNSRFDPTDVGNEREVILQEIAMVEDTPDDLVHDLFNRELWGRHPLGNPVLGSPRVVGALSAEHLREYLRRHYTPHRILIAAAGRVEHQSFCRLWADTLGSPKKSKKLGSDTNLLLTQQAAGKPGRANKKLVSDPNFFAVGSQRQPPIFREPVRRLFDRDLEQLHLLLGTYGLAETDPDRYALYLLNTVLGGNMSSRLFQEIREKRGLAYSVFAYHNSHSDCGSLGIYLGVDPQAAGEAAELAAREIRRLIQEPIRTAELAEARDYARAVLLLAEENMEARMSRLARNFAAFGREVPIEEILQGFERVNPDAIQEVARRLFTRPLTTVALGPLDEDLDDWEL